MRRMTADTPSREQLLYTLHEAAEIEHNLMFCYLYAAFSLKRADPRWSAEEAAAVARWRGAITGVAMDEMTHLALVANLAQSLGGAAHFGRPMLPIEAGPYPAGFVIRLQPFNAATVAHFQFLERPGDVQLPDGEGFVSTRHYRRRTPAGRLSPGAADYDTVGELYASLLRGLQAGAAAQGEAALFIGDPARQVGPAQVALPGLQPVTGLASAIHTIVTQGEGAGAERADSHFSRFSAIAQELAALKAANPAFEPAWPAATNPVMNPPPTPEGKVHITHPCQVPWLDIGNALYAVAMRCLHQGFAATAAAPKAQWLGASFRLMQALVPVGMGLAARPSSDEAGCAHAGLTFTTLRTLALLPEPGAAAVVAERLRQLHARAAALPLDLVAGEQASDWHRVLDTLQGLADELSGTESPRAAPTPPPPPAPAPAAAPAPTLEPELAQGREIDIRFDAARCIHARHCVLQAPTVFKANTPGAWIFPDTLATAALVAVAEQCPSGAITYTRHDGGPAEAPPPVNLLRVRENGPYAVHAPITLVLPEGERQDGHRATLCRCGQSRRKPWCDGSHAAAGFVAGGEPATGDATVMAPLATRDGALSITPLRNGPLHLRGNLELLSGTGRSIAKLGAPNAGETRLCRCGQSRNKPYCDGSHVGAGFSADGC
jgi:CDGSH-type Zn-finger protein/uncharacterized Fe-S cluster protein YjdI